MKPGIIAFVGGAPSHYVRKLHAELERGLEGRGRFFYVFDEGTAEQRGYEEGAYPDHCEFIGQGAHRELFRKVSSLHPELVIFHGHYPRPIASLLLASIAQGWRIAYWSDTNLLDVLDEPWLRRAAKRWIGKWILGRAHALLYIGTANLWFYEWVLGGTRRHAPKLYHVPYPHLSESFPSAVGNERTTRDVVRVIFVGRLAPEKNVAMLLEALSLLPAHLQGQWECRLVGDGPEREALERVRDSLGLGRSVTFTGAVPSDQIPGELAAADVFVILSRTEPWGLVVNEALQAGLPVIASCRAGATIDLVHDGISGYRVSPFDARVIAARIESLISRADSRRELGQQGRRFVSQGSWSLGGAVEAIRTLISDCDAAGEP